MYKLTVVPLISTPGAFAVVDVMGNAADAYPLRKKKAAAAEQITPIARFTRFTMVPLRVARLPLLSQFTMVRETLWLPKIGDAR
jgi:hypothetical protein